jgi:hypothetical protein
MNVIADHRESTALHATMLCFEEFFETILEQLLVFHVISFVLFHVGFIFEGIFAATAVKVSCALAIKNAVLHQTLFCRSISLKAFLVNCRIFAMVIRVHLYITCADVCLITSILNAMVMRLFSIMLTIAKLNCTIVRRGETQKTVAK